MKFVAFPGQEESSPEWGGKARGLAALTGTGLPVPAWFVLLPEAFYASMGLNPSHALAGVDLVEGGDTLLPLQLVPEVQMELSQALAQLCPGTACG